MLILKRAVFTTSRRKDIMYDVCMLNEKYSQPQQRQQNIFGIHIYRTDTIQIIKVVFVRNQKGENKKPHEKHASLLESTTQHNALHCANTYVTYMVDPSLS